MKYLFVTIILFSALFSKDFSLVIEKPFDGALFDVVEDYDRSISAVGFSKSYPSSKVDSTSYTNAFDYLSSVASSHGSQMHLIQVTKYGEILVDKAANLSRYNKAVALIKTPQNGYFVGGYTLDGSMMISRVDANGKIVFTKMFGTKNHDSLHSLIALKDGGVLAIGSSTTTRSSQDNVFETGLGLSDIYITRFSKDGRKIWGKKYGTNHDDKGIDAVESNDGSIIIVGTTEYKDNKNITLLRVNGSGDKIWLKHFDEKSRLMPYKLIRLRDNNFLLSVSKQDEMQKEQIRLIKFNLQEDILIDKEVFTSYSSALLDIQEYSDGGIIGVGYVRDSYNTNALAMFLDANMNMLNQEHFGGKNHDTFHAVSILHNSQAAVVGVNTADYSQESNMWITKLNRDGSMAQISTAIENFFKQLQIIFKDEITQKKIQIRKDLSIEFIDPSLLFAQGVYKLTKEQKEFLNIFGKKLIPFLKANRESIATLEVNGHTSSEWGNNSFTQTYLKNEKLSMNRAYATLSHIFSQQDKASQEWLADVLKGSGLSFSEKINFSNKIENKTKSRRVSFKILLKATKF